MKFVKGQWYSDGNRFYQYDCESHPTKNTHYQFRIAGCNEPSVVFYRLNDLVMLTPASLVPDFSNANEGDECFSAADGVSVITEITNDYCIYIEGNDYAFYANGRYGGDDKHPTLFNSLAQFMAYWQEEALKLKGGSDA